VSKKTGSASNRVQNKINFTSQGTPVIAVALTSTSNGRAESTVTRLPDDGYWTNEEIKVENRVTASVDPNRPDYANYVYKAVLHELVHGLRLDDAYGCAPGQTVMNPILGVNDSGGGLPMQVTEFDRGLIAQQYLDPLPDPGPLPPCNPSWEPDQVQAECDVSCDCHTDSPLLINLSGGGLHLTSVEAGVAFDMDGDGILEQVAWTTSGSEQAFLVLDRNGNGEIDSGFELFGTHTEQAPTFNPNGFAALALLDQPEYGGNGDNYISAAGCRFSRARDPFLLGFSRAFPPDGVVFLTTFPPCA